MSQEIKTRPILFSGAMVRALLDGSKSQTRRIAKITPDQCEDIGLFYAEYQCPYGQSGDRLWVRETFADEGARRNPADCYYRADGEADLQGGHWTPSIFMPRWASRITLKIVSVRVERLQDISEADAIAEGIERTTRHWKSYSGAGGFYRSPIRSYESLWESINGAGSWDANSWVWVVEFKRLQIAN